MARQIITECRDFILENKHLRFCASPLVLSLGTSKWNEKRTFIWKENFGSPILFLFSTSKTLVMLFLFQEWFDMRNVTVIFVCHSSSCTDTSLSALLVILSQVFESTFLDSSLQALFSPVACAPFPTTLFPSSHFYTNMLEYNTLWTVSPFNSDLILSVICTTVKSAIFPTIVVCISLYMK